MMYLGLNPKLIMKVFLMFCVYEIIVLLETFILEKDNNSNEKYFNNFD